ncbi:IPT/TIG domain-containing protein [Kitasatospora sp. GP82]|uniref:IPT/TIG domain-containing protein n=1 Tax=Kitasatospora sp. GP82 TaxID=3035089 RepID=UPI00247333FA|nr:IPT/TIG domain-containing protein [Kitasatospora sp. GP82]MDH6124727.1 hypothetical protein [Kitasatospora sp. GP82]
MAPILLALVPPQGPTTGGNTITLVGTGLSGASAVMFGSTPATSFTVLFDGAITAVAPAGTGAVQVTVVTGAGTSNGGAYRYL